MKALRLWVAFEVALVACSVVVVAAEQVWLRRDCEEIVDG